MAEQLRATWSGTLRVGMAQIPLKMAPASQKLAINLKMTCPEDANPVEQVYVCSEYPDEHHHLDRGPRNPEAPHSGFKCDRAYESPDGKLIPITYEELQSLVANDGQVIDIIETRSAYGFDPAYIAKAYRCWTDPAHEVAIASLCRSLDRRQLIGVGRMVMSKRAYLVALRTDGHKGLTLLRLNWQDEVRPAFPATERKAETDMIKAFDGYLSMIEVGRNEEMASDIRNERDEKLRAIIRRKSGIEAVRTLAASVEYGDSDPE